MFASRESAPPSALAADLRPGTSTIVGLVAHARHVPSLQRETFGDALEQLPDDPRRITIRTCHRVELYGTGDATSLPELAALPAGVERLADVDAVRHLVSVACGLDSAVFGETQILHQIRETLEARHAARPLDPVLERLFQTALRSGREARTFFTGSPRSLADAALDRIAEIGQRQGSAAQDLPILVVGVGRMGRLAAFAATRRGARVILSNRTASRAAELAHEIGGQLMPFGVDGSLAPVGGVIVALAGPWPLGPRDEAFLLQSGTVVVDLSSPPAIRQALASQLGERSISVDDLAVGEGDGPDERTRRRVERVVSKAGGEYCQWLRTRGAVPAIRAVVDAAEARRADELAWLRRRLPDLGPEDVAIVEQMSHRLVAALLHQPLAALTNDEQGELETAARELFGL